MLQVIQIENVHSDQNLAEMKILFTLMSLAMTMAMANVIATPSDISFCVHCPQTMSTEVSDNILKQALRGIVPDDGPNYEWVRIPITKI